MRVCSVKTTSGGCRYILLLFVFHPFGFFEQRLFETEYDGRYTIVSGFFVADHVVPSSEQFPCENALIVFFGQFTQTRVGGHPAERDKRDGG